jgi:hypothetical protein
VFPAEIGGLQIQLLQVGAHGSIKNEHGLRERFKGIEFFQKNSLSSRKKKPPWNERTAGILSHLPENPLNGFCRNLHHVFVAEVSQAGPSTSLDELN